MLQDVFPSSLMKRPNKLERSSLASIFSLDNDQTRLEKSARDKHSSLLCLSVNDKYNKFQNMATRYIDDMFETARSINDGKVNGPISKIVLKLKNCILTPSCVT
jgi:hypothetical protein